MKLTQTTLYLGIACAWCASGCFEAPAPMNAEAVDASSLFPLPRPDAATILASESTSGQASCATPTPALDTNDATTTTMKDPAVQHADNAPPSDVMGDDVVDASATVTMDGGTQETSNTPMGPPAPDLAGQCLFTEVMADPSGRTDAVGEWVELLNTTDQPLDLKGCQLGEGADNDPVFAESVVIDAGAYAAISRNAAPGFSPAAEISMSLRNTDDILMLRCKGVLIDSLAYDAAAQYPIVAGASLSLSPEAVALGDNDAPELFCLGTTDYGGDLGTPGAPNDPCPAP